MIGFITGLLFLINIFVWAGLIIIFGIIKYILPFKAAKQFITRLQNDVFPSVWTDFNSGILRLAAKIDWQIYANGELARNHWYFVFANHQSWADILVMQHVFNRKIPLLKFFLKKELLWSLPMGGLACWMLDYPFMKRYTKNYLKKHPEKKNADIETTKAACNIFKHRPTAVMNFLEGTRFTQEKQQERSSPYKHLLRPKAGGLAYVISEMRDVIKEVIDVTIIYDHPEPTFWNLLSGKVHKIRVYYTVRELTPDLYGDYYNDPAFRRHFQGWVNTLWKEKDKLIETETATSRYDYAETLTVPVSRK